MTRPTSERPLVTCRELVIGYRRRALLPPLSLAIAPGDLWVVLGRNGSGKTTLFRTLLGVLRPVGGRLERAPDLRIAYVPQRIGLDSILPMHAHDVVDWGRLSGWSFLRPWPGRADREAGQRALERAGAAELAHASFRDLSEGQKQKILFARMLATEAELVVLDEPTAAMDAVAEREALRDMAALARDRRVAVVVVSHHLEVAAQLADRVLFLDRQERAVVSGDAATVFAHPAFRAHYGALAPAAAGAP